MPLYRTLRSALLALLILGGFAGLPATATSRTSEVAWIGPADHIGAVALDADGRTLYGHGQSGFWRFTGDWTRVSDAILTEGGAPAPSILLAAHPTEPGHIVAGLNDSRFTGSPLRLSRDGGVTWVDPTNGEWTHGRVTAIHIDSSDPRVIVAGARLNNGNGRIMRSADGGATWQSVQTIQSEFSAGAVHDLTGHRDRPGTFWAAIGVYHGGGLLRSDDGGLTWRSVPTITPPLYFPKVIEQAAVDADRIVVAWQAPSVGGLVATITTDGGASWQTSGHGLPAGPVLSWQFVPDSASGFFLSLSNQSGTVPWARPTQIYHSGDGEAWSLLAGGLALGPASIAHAAGERALYIGNSEGVHRLQTAPQAPQVAPRFQAYYAEMDGPRLLGAPISGEITRPPFPRQYFEKGVLEDHLAAGITAADWRFMYGLLVDELQQVRALLPVGGDLSTLTYAEIHDFADPTKRSAPPIGSGPTVGPQGMVFVPYTPDLSRAPGQYVPHYFWTYLNRADLFPAGWLHDVGLPMTPVLDATVDKGPYRGRRIKVQAFQRTILTYDPQNPPEWQIERANVGTDYLRAFPIAGR